MVKTNSASDELHIFAVSCRNERAKDVIEAQQILKKRCRPVLGTDAGIDVVEHRAFKVCTFIPSCDTQPAHNKASHEYFADQIAVWHS